ncbi:MAG: hypothetical protein ACLPKE_22865 [Streptosporangiaceae bacterium]
MPTAAQPAPEEPSRADGSLATSYQFSAAFEPPRHDRSPRAVAR